MKNEWMKKLRRIPILGASIFSIVTFWNIIFDLYIRQYDYVQPMTMLNLGFALLFIFLTLIIFEYDFYKMR